MSTLDSNTWKISYNNANHCGMMELANTPTRPPWRPAASSITAAKENNVPVPQRNDLGSKPKSEDLAIPPQYMSVTDLLAAMPTRQRLPKAQTSLNSYALHVDPRHATSLKSLCAAGQDTVRLTNTHDASPKADKDELAPTSKESTQLHSTGSGHPSPPFGARSLHPSSPGSQASSRAPLEAGSNRHHAGTRISANTSPAFPRTRPQSPPIRTAGGRTSDRRASFPSSARSVAVCSGQNPSNSGSTRTSRGSRTVATSRTMNTNTNTGTSSRPVSTRHSSMSPSTKDARSSSKFDTFTGSARQSTLDTHRNKDFPSRGTLQATSTPLTGRSSRCVSGTSTPSQRSGGGTPIASGRCSPPTPPSTSFPSKSLAI
ncbi:uncharacterized protein [Physcomitrium patens]|uniref:uncharacterized protein isoform X2 n=1 Tax=Physcomitrium patens TaxID=3218 RepID=UPI003CCE1167